MLESWLQETREYQTLQYLQAKEKAKTKRKGKKNKKQETRPGSSTWSALTCMTWFQHRHILRCAYTVCPLTAAKDRTGHGIPLIVNIHTNAICKSSDQKQKNTTAYLKLQANTWPMQPNWRSSCSSNQNAIFLHINVQRVLTLWHWGVNTSGIGLWVVLSKYRYQRECIDWYDGKVLVHPQVWPREEIKMGSVEGCDWRVKMPRTVSEVCMFFCFCFCFCFLLFIMWELYKYSLSGRYYRAEATETENNPG